jgi:2-iminobutanoate/2-iminopropanoate deaminase
VNWETKYIPEYWDGKKLAYPNVPAESPKFAKTEIVGNLIFVSGCTGQDTITGGPTPTTFEGQMKLALRKLQMAMEASGSSLNNVVKTMMLLKRAEDYPTMRKLETEYYQTKAPYLIENPPASTFINVASLAKPEFLVEIDAIGVRDPNMPGWEVKYIPEYWDGKKLAYPNVPAESPKFAKTEIVGNLIFVSGCTGQDTITGGPTPPTFEGQMQLALRKLQMAMEASDSSLENVVKTLMIIRNIEDYQTMRRMETECYQANAPFLVSKPPASTILVAAGLAKPEFLVEIDAIGVGRKDRPGWEATWYAEYLDGKPLVHPNVPLGAGKYARSEVVGNLVIISGATGKPIDGSPVATTIEGQMDVAMTKLQTAMEEVGSSLDKMVKTFIQLKRLEDYPAMRKCELEYYQKHAPYLVENPPASTFMQPVTLGKADYLVEIEAYGVL